MNLLNRNLFISGGRKENKVVKNMPRRSILAGIIVCLTVFQVLPLASADETYQLEGKVYDILNRTPLPEAKVTVTEVKPVVFVPLTITIRENYTVTISSTVDVSVIQVVVTNSHLLIHVNVAGKNCILKLKKVVSVTITIYVSSDCDSYVTYTDENGYWSIQVSEGKYYVNVEKDGYTSYLHYLEVKQNLTLTSYLLLLSDKTEIEKRLDNLENRMAQVEQNLVVLQNELNSLQNELDLVEENLDKLRSDFQTFQSQVENALAMIDQELVQIKDVLKVYGELLENHEKRITVLEERMDNCDKKLAELDTRLKQCEDNINAIWNEVRSIWDRIGIIENSIADLAQHIRVIENNLSILSARVDVLENRVDVLSERLDVLDGRVDALEVRVANCEIQINVLMQRVKNIEERLTIPSGIPLGTVMFYVRENIDNQLVPMDNVFCSVYSYNIVPFGGYTENGRVKFENVVLDRVVLRCLSFRMEYVLTKDLELKLIKSENEVYPVTDVYIKIEGIKAPYDVELDGMIIKNSYDEIVTFSDVRSGRYTVKVTDKEGNQYSRDFEVGIEPVAVEVSPTTAYWKYVAIGSAVGTFSVIGGVTASRFVGKGRWRR
jgi:predicted  nucleic acid-binding Zn-ribbon protein